MKKPVIAITVSSIASTSRIPNAYSEAVANAGGLPILIPNQFPLTDLKELCEQVDGILFSGGGDIAIDLFDGEPNEAIGKPSRKRDALEINLVKKALEMGTPIFGICRGLQVINVALGGTLITHIPDQFSKIIVHDTDDEVLGRDYLAHDVNLETGTLLYNILKKPVVSVNSFHHQAIKDLAPGLRVTARATDGLIEAVEVPGETFKLVGVQWHPECLQNMTEQQDLFKAFIAACR